MAFTGICRARQGGRRQTAMVPRRRSIWPHRQRRAHRKPGSWSRSRLPLGAVLAPAECACVLREHLRFWHLAITNGGRVRCAAGSVQSDNDRSEDKSSAESFAPGELLAEEHDPGLRGHRGGGVVHVGAFAYSPFDLRCGTCLSVALQGALRTRVVTGRCFGRRSRATPVVARNHLLSVHPRPDPWFPGSRRVSWRAGVSGVWLGGRNERSCLARRTRRNVPVPPCRGRRRRRHGCCVAPGRCRHILVPGSQRQG